MNVVTSNDECGLEESKRIYTLKRSINKELYQLFIPFGIVDKTNDISHTVNIYDYSCDKKDLPDEKEALFTLKGKLNSNKLSIILKNAKNHLLTIQRIECQLRKFQSCISCSACSNICPYDAINVVDGYEVDEQKCKKCKKCIAYYHKGCLLAKTTMDY